MIFDGNEQNPGAKFLLSLASLVVVVFGLKFAAPILLPAALALFLAVLSLPVMLFLQHRRVPPSAAIGITMLVNVAVFGLIVLLASGSLEELQFELPAYASRLSALQEQWLLGLETRLGIPLENYVATDLVNPSAIVDFAGSALGRIAQFVSTTFLVLLITIFMLSEAIVFPAKIRFLVGGPLGQEDRLAKVVGEIQTYLGIKTVMSLATGIILGVWCYVMELDFPVLLGLVAFVLNYVPTVGSIIAAVPAVLLSLVLHGTLPHALMVTAGYVVVNTLFGNILEPNLMGRRLGLSTLVVILSLLFWGWTWGPLGALLSVPLTVIVKIWLENTPDLRWVAVLLDKNPPRTPVPPVAEPPAD
ncbi:MAG TPA: AI-2E family transporter [Longimicrobiales bacterium]|nr:AI-2E family transporter [Longimicrobiales bacterium]